MLHLGDGVFESLRYHAGKGTMLGPVHGVPNPFEQRLGKGDRNALFLHPGSCKRQSIVYEAIEGK